MKNSAKPERRRLRSAVVEWLLLAASTAGVLGTAILLFTLTFHERRAAGAPHPSPIADDLLDLAVSPAGRVTAVGHNGRILQSAAGGRTFVFRESGVTTPLAAVGFRDERVGLAAGYGGVILRTTDGGEKWTSIASGVDLYLTSVRFRSGGEVFAAGEWGTILRSRDDGASWAVLTNREHDFIVADIDFAEDGGGWAVGEFGRALASADGGATWQERQLLDDESSLFSVDVVSAREIWVAGAGSVLLHSTDGGTTWTRTTAPCEKTQLLRIRFAAARGYAVGRRCAVVSEDAGASWRKSALGDAIPYSWIYGLDVTADGVWAAGYHESLFHAGPDDRSWQRVVVERGTEQAPGLFVGRNVKLEPTSAGS